MMVQDLDFRCLGYKKLIKIINRKGQKEKFKNNQKLLRDAQGILNMLQRFSNREQFFVYPKDIIGADCMEFLMDDDDYQNIEAYSFNNKIQQLAIKTRLPLKAFIDEFEKSNNLSYQPKSKNRSYTDEEEFVYSIAECYFENIGWPSLNNGFFTTVQLTKKFLSLLYKDPSRPIKKALKKFAATHQRQN